METVKSPGAVRSSVKPAGGGGVKPTEAGTPRQAHAAYLEDVALRAADLRLDDLLELGGLADDDRGALHERHFTALLGPGLIHESPRCSHGDLLRSVDQGQLPHGGAEDPDVERERVRGLHGARQRAVEEERP